MKRKGSSRQGNASEEQSRVLLWVACRCLLASSGPTDFVAPSNTKRHPLRITSGLPETERVSRAADLLPARRAVANAGHAGPHPRARPRAGGAPRELLLASCAWVLGCFESCCRCLSRCFEYQILETSCAPTPPGLWGGRAAALQVAQQNRFVRKAAARCLDMSIRSRQKR